MQTIPLGKKEEEEAVSENRKYIKWKVGQITKEEDKIYRGGQKTISPSSL